VLFQWDEKNLLHLEKHGVRPDEAEHVVNNASPPFPREIGDDKHVVWGPTEAGRHLQVIFVYKSAEHVDYDSLTFEQLVALSDAGEEESLIRVIHAMELPPAKMKRYRRIRRRK
jgi:uncharacterized DUF497 family protein